MPKGRPPNTKTFDKERARLILREEVFADLREMVKAQIKNSKGLSYLVSRDRKTGKFTKLTAEQAEKLLAPPTEGQEQTLDVIEVWEQPPSAQAFKELVDQTIDKASQRVELDGKLAGDLTFRWEQ